MKFRPTAFLILFACFTAGYHAGSQELPMFGRLPNPGRNWYMHEQGTNAHPPSRTSWLVLTNSQSGDVLSFHEERIAGAMPSTPTNQGPWTEMAISLFPGGFPAWSKPPGVRVTSSEWGRNGVVNLNKGQVAVESTTIWEDESGGRRLSHAYGLALGELRLYVQHTSTKIITPEFAQRMADGLIELHSARRNAR